jgi:hypothetical protein
MTTQRSANGGEVPMPEHKVQVELDGEDLDSFRDLRSWLADQQPVRMYGRLVDVRRQRTGEMSGIGDAIALVVGGGLSAAQLVFSIKQWRATRHPTAPVVLILPDPAAEPIRVDTDDETAIAAVIRRLEQTSE